VPDGATGGNSGNTGEGEATILTGILPVILNSRMHMPSSAFLYASYKASAKSFEQGRLSLTKHLTRG
jgi:hypothetical protein